MPITFFNRKRLCADTNALGAAEITGILKENGIEYVLDKRSDHYYFAVPMTFRASFRLKPPEPKKRSYVYIIYVRRRDYEKAKRLIG